MAAILTLAEHRDGKLRRPALEAVSEARRLADAGAGGSVATLALGPGAAALAAELGAYGADVVYVCEDAAFASYATEAYARALVQACAAAQATCVLVPFTSLGKDLAPRVAARLGAGLVSDCVALHVDAGRLVARRPMYAGKAYATVRWNSPVQVASLRPNVFALAAPQDGRAVTTTTLAIDGAARARVSNVEATAGGKLELSEAQIVVSGGRGLKGPEHFHLVEELAAAFGAAVGASRAIVDAGWVDHHLQVGQTGKTVSPQLYVACGISGAIQHLAGMSSSKIIVAINKDADAPIFKAANYGVLGDVFEILPQLTTAVQAHRAGRG
jgi:electron transfer flavoprotein alpha subunit